VSRQEIEYESAPPKDSHQKFSQSNALDYPDMTNCGTADPDEETELPMLLAMYERGPCSSCREKTVRRLIERGALTEELRLECSFDANDDIRDLVRGSPPTPPPG